MTRVGQDACTHVHSRIGSFAPSLGSLSPWTVGRTTNHGPAVLGRTIIVHLPTDLTLDVLLVRFPLGIIPKKKGSVPPSPSFYLSP